MYRRGDTSNENNESLFKTFHEIVNKKYSHVLVFGDFNFKEINWEKNICLDSNNTAFNFIECIRDCFLVQHIKEPTRQRGTDSPCTLDLLFTNDENMIKDLKYLAPLGRSDHSIVKFTVACYAEHEGPRIQVCYDRGNYAKFNEIINEVNWEKEFSEYPDDVDKQFDYFEKIYKQAEIECVPRKGFFYKW